MTPLAPDDAEAAARAAPIARAIVDGFDRHYRSFRAISAAAKDRFERADWAGVRLANHQRIDLYDARVSEAVDVLRARFPEAASEALWPAIKRATISLLISHSQPELAETFYNSVACRLLHRTYYSNQYLFWRPAVSTEHIEAFQPTWRSYFPAAGLRAMLRAILADTHLLNPWEDLERDLAAVVARLNAFLPRPREAQPGLQVQVLSSLFFRNRTAVLVGKLLNGSQHVPFAVAILQNRRGQLYVDALLLEPKELGALFSLSRVYFMADMEVPSAFVAFLKTIFPEKPAAELYTALGLQKQGKTLFYRDLFEHLKHSADRFAVAPGVRGMVMLVFTLPSFPYVFKLIRDRFEPPKDTDRKAVEQQYRRVKYHDRVGRLADTLEFSNVALPESRLDPALVADLERLAPSQLERDGERLIIKHLYVERRMTPLDVALRSATVEKQRVTLRDYGRALKELAGAGLFPGDLLLKNFGVTRFGRVVFYDYDEIAPLATCHFRPLPTARSDEEELAGEAWFHVGPHDIFPEEFPQFLFPDAAMRALFIEEHPDLCTPKFWVEKQAQLQRGEEDEALPYPEERRFPHAHA